MKNTLMIVLGIIVIALIGVGIYKFNSADGPAEITTNDALDVATTTPTDVVPEQKEAAEVVIGKSVEGRDITAYNFGTGENRVLVIGGIHGGYSWNTALLGYETADYIKAHPDMIPSDVTVTVIPVLNPDGLVKAAGTADKFAASDVTKTQSVLTDSRTNDNKVDLSRNFDCNWKSDAVWQNKPISGGTSAFSEPESKAVKAYIESHEVAGAVVLYSAANGVYASKCGDDIMPETTALTAAYAKASGYPSNDSYDYYETSGDIVNWLAKVKVPAISVLLSNHTDTELTKNIKGLEAVIDLYSKI